MVERSIFPRTAACGIAGGCSARIYCVRSAIGRSTGLAGPEDFVLFDGELAGNGINESHGNEADGFAVFLLALAIHDFHGHDLAVVCTRGQILASGKSIE